MTDMLNNPWVTGIGGGIISSLIVFFVTRYFFSKREKREYLQKLETANNEILYSIRPLVIEKRIPSKDILNAIRISTAKKYGVKQEDLYNEYSLSYELIKEIMGNSFLSSDQKIEFCNLLNSMKQQEIGDSDKEVEVIYLNKKDSISSKYNSILLAMTTFAMVLTMSLFISNTVTDSSSIDIFAEIFPFLAIMTLVPIMAVTLFYTLRMFRDKEWGRQKLSEKSNEMKDKESDMDEKNVA